MRVVDVGRSAEVASTRAPARTPSKHRLPSHVPFEHGRKSASTACFEFSPNGPFHSPLPAVWHHPCSTLRPWRRPPAGHESSRPIQTVRDHS